MKKFFFFKAGSGNSQVPPPTDKQVNWESSSKKRLSNQSINKVENSCQSSNRLFPKPQKPNASHCPASPRLRRSLSFSSVAFSGNDGLGPWNSQSPSSSSTSSMPAQQLNYSSCGRSLTPEKKVNTKPHEVAAAENAHKVKKPRPGGSPKALNDSSKNSSFCSSNVSSTVLDLYIDGEQQQERSRAKSISSQRNHCGTGNGNSGGRRPPRVQHTAPASPIDDVKGRPRFRSFREPRGAQPCVSLKDWAESELFGHESQRELAKHVIEKLSHSHISTKANLKDCDPDTPITIEEIYGKYLGRCSGSTSVWADHKNIPSDELYETVKGYHPEEPFDFQGKHHTFGEDMNSVDGVKDKSEELQRKFKEAKERAFYLSKEFVQENFLLDGGFDGPALVQKIRHLSEERVSLALEVSSALQDRIEDRASANENLRWANVELQSRTRRLEKEKNELQAVLEKELDRRSNDWSAKLEKYQSEEHRLRERVRELAEQNVSLQREVSFFNEKVEESRSMVTHSESQLRDLTLNLEEVRQENQDLQQNLSVLQEKYLAAEEERVCVHRNYEEKEKECQELQMSITRLLRTCTEQEKTISGLREGLNGEIEKQQSYENFDKHVGRLQKEQMRLTGVEQAMRKEVELHRSEADSLRHENINLLTRLKGNLKEGGFCTFQLDQELCNLVCCLQSQGLLLLNESTQLCLKLLEFIKGKFTKDGLYRQFVIESDVRVQGFKRGTENLSRSLQKMSTLLHEKSNLLVLGSQSTRLVESGGLNNNALEEILRYELKAESLLTSALRDKLLSKQLDVEQLQAELATAVRGNDILKCEVQNAMDTLSCENHQLKDLELQMLKKDESINHLENDLEESKKELMVMRGILPKVSQERDLLWEEVKHYSEKNKLLNSEVNLLKKNIDALDEDVLLKEGQITILKESLDNGTFGLLSSEPTHEFRLD